MMINIPLGKIALVMGLLFIVLIVTFFLMRKWRVKKKKKQLQKLKKEFKEKTRPNIKENSVKDTEILDDIIEEIENSVEKGETTVKISLEEGYELGLETSDIIVLRTPRGNLHKSFPKLRFEKIEEINEEFKIVLKE